MIGTACDDGDACTTGEFWGTDCLCGGGIPEPDDDNDGVCNAEDQCPNFDDALIGTACEDGDACTTGEIWGTDCLCGGGTPVGDDDNDGVCNTEDQCPNFDDALIGTACDDGDACTTGEIWGTDCLCGGGTPVGDDDNDGVCNAEDQCPNFDDALIGTACDDGDACTTGEIWGTDCLCGGGTPVGDDDNDGVCNTEDQCPNFDDALIGTACDDGDACTTGEIWGTDCLCGGGIPVGDDDNDGVCNTEDQCPNFDDALIGTACDDGDACTTGEIWGTDCLCGGGTPVGDDDNDGVCNTEDQCPNFDDALIGTACDDGDACTTGEIWGTDCQCGGGIPVGDDDNDGVCNAEDQCPGLDDALIGTPCDDGNDCTVGETYDNNCNCSGGVEEDTDNDGICDPLDECPDDPNNECNDPVYCESSGNSTQYEYIEQIVVNTIDNTSGDNNGYADFTDQITDLTKDNSYNITLVPGFPAGSYTEYWAIWIDYNSDGDFDDVDETVFTGSSNATINDVIDIPTTVSTGTTRMRISMRYNQAPPSCGNFQWGEVEDYTVNILNNCVVGDPCDDGDACTEGETYDENCDCLGGTPVGDDDNDGVCNAEDQCPDFDDNLIGTACDDGDACTEGETYDDNCNCSGGIFQDADGDTVCDAEDQCPGFDDLLIGTACDDGDACTEGETWGTDCLCSGGTPVGDDDNDGVCNTEDVCPDFDDNLIGTLCDDGDECTVGETYDESCNCSGGTLSDLCNNCPIYNWNENPILSYDPGQDLGTYEIQDTGRTLFMTGNAWKAVEINYDVTANSVLQFDFKSTVQGEIHEISFDNNLLLAPNHRIVVYGDQGYGGTFDNPVYSGSGDWETFVISLGDNFTGSFTYLVMTADDDESAEGNSYFRDVRIFEDVNGDLLCDDGTELCASAGQSTQYEYIESVSIDNFVNNSGNDNGYGDYTDQVVNLSQGNVATVDLVPGFTGNSYNEYWRIWIDYNQNNDYTDPGEMVFEDFSNAAINGNFTVPMSALPGNTNMRIAMQYNAYSEPCETFAEGEVEDYTVNISGAALIEDVDTRADSEASIAVYPVPTKNILNIDFSNFDQQSGALYIYNNLGMLVHQKYIDQLYQKNTQTLDVRSFNNGTYILVLEVDGKKYTQRFVIID